jgi:tRNA-dihydrouridine synthase B
MRVGNLDIGTKLFLAPMAEVTDSSFRKICKEHGAGITFTQMVSAEGILKNNFETLRHFSFSRTEKPIGVQVLGNNPAILKEAANELSKMGADLIDLNCGCPVDKVTSNKMGSALLDDPQILGSLIKNLVDGSNGVPVSIKLRLGKNKSSINIFETAKAAEDNGASLIFVHARTREDKYETDADWSWLKKIKEKVNIPVVGNGSLFTPQHIKEMLALTGCDSAMVARGALGDPFIFSRYKLLLEKNSDPGLTDIKVVHDTIIKHIKFLQEEFGEVIALDKAKKHSIWYFKNYPEINSFLEKVFSAKNLDQLRELISVQVCNIQLNGKDFREKDEIHKKFQKKVLFWLTDENENEFG